MQDILKEMGKVCENRRIGEFLKDFHAKRFTVLKYWNKEQAEAHQVQWSYWTKKLNTINDHIKQLHGRIKKDIVA